MFFLVMRQQRNGRVINISSSSGREGRAVISVESDADPTLLNEAKLRCELDPLVWNRDGRYISDESQGDCHDPRCDL